MLGILVCFLPSVYFLRSFGFSKKRSFRNTISVLNSLDTDQIWLSDAPDLGFKLFAKIIKASDKIHN